MPHLTILGGGPSGLAVGYYARKCNFPFTIYEASDRVGGNCITIKHGEFLFDSGAHRLHDKFEDITKEIRRLLGDDLQKIDAPSQIYHEGKFIDFPLSPFNLLRNLGLYNCWKAGADLIYTRLKKRSDDHSFENFAIHTYGRNLAQRFLLDYSQKLWGLPCRNLSPAISGSRMKGLDLKTFLIEAIFGRQRKSEHLDGSFYYPRMGYGEISEALANFCEGQNIHRRCRVTKIRHDLDRIKTIEVNGSETVEVDLLINTLPINLFISIMDPAVPAEMEILAKSLRFRNVVLVALFIDRAGITANASIYFPDANYPFTRVYEPRNRSRWMAPSGKTSLVAEIPCNGEDELWKGDPARLQQLVIGPLREIFHLAEPEILDSRVVRIPNAYPVLEIGCEEKSEQLFRYLGRFKNLHLSGRSGLFAYTHLHDLMKLGKDLVEAI